ncbi:MAG TPA: hypothetical protein VF522_11500 [Ramlibacter sp.]|uniref:hypothetical protein n=1 Tax=Ramlibacter sp. TaxID=1917967 RepID=UPI002ED1193B
MATAFHPLPNLFDAFHALLDRLAPRAAPAHPPRTPVQRPVWNGPVRQPPARPQPARALRIVRLVEPSASRAVAGRMVISGRMADVCAELDRMAALESRAA